MIISIDYDGCVVEEVGLGTPHALRDGAADGLRALKESEHVLILHSVRCSAPINDEIVCGRLYPGGKIPTGLPRSVAESIRYFEEMRSFLRSQNLWTVEEGGVFDLVWRLPGKPYADVYADDRAINMRAKDAWRSLAFVLGGG